MILAISGSLRQRSVNSAALRAAADAAARQGIRMAITDAVRELPPFDPDLEGTPPEPVVRFLAMCAGASGVLLAVPEYAFGIPGAFKNALDWTVGGGCLYRKPVAIVELAPPGRGAHVRRALEDVLTALDADVAHYPVPVGRHDRDASGDIANPAVLDRLEAVVAELVQRTGVGRAA